MKPEEHRERITEVLCSLDTEEKVLILSQAMDLHREHGGQFAYLQDEYGVIEATEYDDLLDAWEDFKHNKYECKVCAVGAVAVAVAGLEKDILAPLLNDTLAQREFIWAVEAWLDEEFDRDTASKLIGWNDSRPAERFQRDIGIRLSLLREEFINQKERGGSA